MAIQSAIDILLKDNKEISSVNVAYVVNNTLNYHHGVTSQEVGHYLKKSKKMEKGDRVSELSTMGMSRSRQMYKRRPKK